MKKLYKFKVKYTVLRELKVELDETQQELLLNADNTLIEVYLDEFGYAEFIGDIQKNECSYEIDYYEEIAKVTYIDDTNLKNLDICFFSYEVNNEVFSDFIYDNKATEYDVKAYIIKSPKHEHINIQDSDIFELTINR